MTTPRPEGRGFPGSRPGVPASQPTPGVVLVGTARRDGSARISRVEPLVMDGELWLSMMRTSAKVAD